MAAKPLITLYNKVDKLPHPEAITFLTRKPQAVVTSALTGAGFSEIKAAIAETLELLETSRAAWQARRRG